MLRIYFDKQIFSFLQKKEQPKYQKLNEDLKKYSHNFLFCFSHAHLLDLQNDETDHKFEDLKFMETLVDNNYLCHYWGEKQAYCYLLTPTEAFNSLNEDEDLGSTNLSDIFHSVFNDLPGGDKLKDALLNLPLLDLKSLNIDNYPPEAKEVLSKMIPLDKSDITMGDFLQKFSTLYANFVQGKDYKNLRKYIKENLNLPTYDVDYNGIDFNEDLKNTPFGKTFVEFVNQSLNPDGKKEITRDSFFHSAFTSLNILGIDQEPNKKAYFNNTVNDGHHGYYGAYCDYVVSDDRGFLKKCKLLYKLLGIETKVLHIDEFIQQIHQIGENEEPDAITFMKLLRYNGEHGLVIKHQPSVRFPNRTTTTIKTNHLFGGLFNRLTIIDEPPKRYLMLSCNRENYSNFLFYKEEQTTTNRLIKIFGPDQEFRGEYSDKDLQQRKEDVWEGRIWTFDTVAFDLHINEGTREFGLMIGPLIEEDKE